MTEDTENNVCDKPTILVPYTLEGNKLYVGFVEKEFRAPRNTAADVFPLVSAEVAASLGFFAQFGRESVWGCPWYGLVMVEMRRYADPKEKEERVHKFVRWYDQEGACIDVPDDDYGLKIRSFAVDDPLIAAALENVAFQNWTGIKYFRVEEANLILLKLLDDLGRRVHFEKLPTLSKNEEKAADAEEAEEAEY